MAGLSCDSRFSRLEHVLRRPQADMTGWMSCRGPILSGPAGDTLVDASGGDGTRRDARSALSLCGGSLPSRCPPRRFTPCPPRPRLASCTVSRHHSDRLHRSSVGVCARHRPSPARETALCRGRSDPRIMVASNQPPPGITVTTPGSSGRPPFRAGSDRKCAFCPLQTPVPEPVLGSRFASRAARIIR